MGAGLPMMDMTRALRPVGLTVFERLYNTGCVRRQVLDEKIATARSTSSTNEMRSCTFTPRITRRPVSTRSALSAAQLERNSQFAERMQKGFELRQKQREIMELRCHSSRTSSPLSKNPTPRSTLSNRSPSRMSSRLPTPAKRSMAPSHTVTDEALGKILLQLTRVVAVDESHVPALESIRDTVCGILQKRMSCTQ